MKICTIDSCDSPVLARSFCRKHYLRWYKHGDPLCVLPSPKNTGAKKHGFHKHPCYKIWWNMMDRCYNPSCHAYARYGGAGITVCKRWHSLENFIHDMSPRPQGASLDRIDNNKGYSKDNCRWASYTTQSRNRRYVKLTFEKAESMRNEPRRGKNGRGNGFTIAEIAEKYGVSHATAKKVLAGTYWRSVEKVAPGVIQAIKK